MEDAARAHVDHDVHGVLARDVIDAVCQATGTERATIAAVFYGHARRGGFVAVYGAFGETRYVVTRYLLETGRQPREFMARTDGAPRTHDLEQVYRALWTAAHNARTWVTSEQVRVALEQSGTVLRSTDINAVRVRLRTLATTKHRGAARTQVARVARAERLVAPGRTAAFWWPLELGEPIAPPGVASRAHGLRLVVAMAVRSLGRPILLRELKMWARARPQIPEASLLLEPNAIPLLQKMLGYDQREAENAWGHHRVLPLDAALEQAGTYVTCGAPNQADRLAVSLVIALERYQPALDHEQILALRAHRSLAMPALQALAEIRAGAARYAFAKALGRCEAYGDVDAQLRELADRELARCGQLVAWHASVTEGDSDRFRDGRVIAERLAHHAAVLPQLLDLPHRAWRGVIKGPATEIPAESLRPAVERVADRLGDSPKSMARWVDLAPRLTRSKGTAGGAGRQLLVDPIDGLPHHPRTPARAGALRLDGHYGRTGRAHRARPGERRGAGDRHPARGPHFGARACRRSLGRRPPTRGQCDAVDRGRTMTPERW